MKHLQWAYVLRCIFINNVVKYTKICAIGAIRSYSIQPISARKCGIGMNANKQTFAITYGGFAGLWRFVASGSVIYACSGIAAALFTPWVSTVMSEDGNTLGVTSALVIFGFAMAFATIAAWIVVYRLQRRRLLRIALTKAPAWFKRVTLHGRYFTAASATDNQYVAGELVRIKTYAGGSGETREVYMIFLAEPETKLQQLAVSYSAEASGSTSLNETG